MSSIDAAKGISDFLQSNETQQIQSTQGSKETETLGDWISNTNVDSAEGNFVHDIDVERRSKSEIWASFSKFSENMLAGQEFFKTASDLNHARMSLAMADYNSASEIQKEMGSMRSEFEGFLAAVRTKEPDAAARAVNSFEDKQVLAGSLMLIKHQLETDPEANVEELQAAADTLMSLFNGEEVSKEQLTALEPHLESLGYKLFPHEVREDYVADLIKQGSESLRDAKNIHQRIMS